MTYEGGATKGLGHHVSGVVCRGYILQKDIVTLDGVADEVELNPNVARTEGGLGSRGNDHAGFIILANVGRARGGMAKF